MASVHPRKGSQSTSLQVLALCHSLVREPLSKPTTSRVLCLLNHGKLEVLVVMNVPFQPELTQSHPLALVVGRRAQDASSQFLRWKEV